MKRIVTVRFKDGNKIIADTKADAFGWFDLGNGISLSFISGTVYRQEGNIICGEDITDEVDTIDIYMEY